MNGVITAALPSFSIWELLSVPPFFSPPHMGIPALIFADYLHYL